MMEFGDREQLARIHSGQRETEENALVALMVLFHFVGVLVGAFIITAIHSHQLGLSVYSILASMAGLSLNALFRFIRNDRRHRRYQAELQEVIRRRGGGV